MSQKRAPRKENVEWWAKRAKAATPINIGGACLAEWRREQQNARTKLAEHGLDMDGNLTDWARKEGYKEPK